MARRQTLLVRALSDEERDLIETCAGSEGFRPFAERRGRILLASSRGQAPLQIAAEVGVDDETVRRAIRDFNARGVDALIEGSPRPRRTGERFIPGGREALIDILRRTPRHYGLPGAEWTLELLADVAFAEGITMARVSDETIRVALLRHGVKWRLLKRRMRLDSRRAPSPHGRVGPGRARPSL
jgi:hypothetical protein